MAYYAKPPIDPEHDLLPTYEAATTRDPIPLISRYLLREDVFAASLVSHNWRLALMPILWEEPHRYWGLGERSELTSFLLFLRTISRLPEPIYYTRTLSLETVRASIYTTLPAKWLSDILTKFPLLRVLKLSDFPFFDHASLVVADGLQPHPELQQLKASSYNSTAAGLCTLLQKLPGLLSLDLSSCNGANHTSTLQAIAQLHSLHTLALRDLKLDDVAAVTLCKAVGTRLRSLDLRGNLLTDATASNLLDWSFAPPSYMSEEIVVPEEGLTHLRIADNRFSMAGAVALVKSTRLVTFDFGSPKTREGVLQLVPALSMYAHSTLRTLRITHRVVMAPQGLRRRMLRKLKTLVLTAVPEWAPSGDVKALLEFIATTRMEEGDSLEILELEMVTGAEAEDVGGVLEGEFSFFDGGDEEGSSWAEGKKGVERLETLKEVKKAREGKQGWEGRIRVLRDLGGRESRETGVE
ncbi:RNI-like protein, partial [Wilcoxina mikolae CBS 423.85]